MNEPQAPVVAPNELLESAIWRANGFEAQVDIVRGHKACNEVLLVRGVFGECWAPIDEIYPRNWRAFNSNPSVLPPAVPLVGSNALLGMPNNN